MIRCYSMCDTSVGAVFLGLLGAQSNFDTGALTRSRGWKVDLSLMHKDFVPAQ